MALDVHVLGTASARPTPERAVSGSLVKGPDGIAVIDCGEGFQTRYALQRRRLKTFAVGSTLKPSAVDVLAFTHGHLDHTWGALPWLQSMDLEHRQQELLVLGPSSAEALDALLNGEALPQSVPPRRPRSPVDGVVRIGRRHDSLPDSVGAGRRKGRPMD